MYEMQQIAEAVGRRPFEPLTLQLSTGEKIEIRHPDGLRYTDSAVLVFAGSGKTEGSFETYKWIGLDHIVEVAPATL